MSRKKEDNIVVIRVDKSTVHGRFILDMVKRLDERKAKYKHKGGDSKP